MQDSVGLVYATRTISTEQWARAAMADDTLPVRSLSTRHTPLEPTRPSAVAYDSRGGTSVAGERVRAIARMMKSSERLYKRRAAWRPDFDYNVARAATGEFRCRTVSGVKREVQCLLKIGILAYDRLK